MAIALVNVIGQQPPPPDIDCEISIESICLWNFIACFLFGWIFAIVDIEINDNASTEKFISNIFDWFPVAHSFIHLLGQSTAEPKITKSAVKCYAMRCD